MERILLTIGDVKYFVIESTMTSARRQAASATTPRQETSRASRDLPARGETLGGVWNRSGYPWFGRRPVWAEPLRAPAPHYGISDAALGHVCATHSIPRPAPATGASRPRYIQCERRLAAHTVRRSLDREASLRHLPRHSFAYSSAPSRYSETWRVSPTTQLSCGTGGMKLV